MTLSLFVFLLLIGFARGAPIQRTSQPTTTSQSECSWWHTARDNLRCLSETVTFSIRSQKLARQDLDDKTFLNGIQEATAQVQECLAESECNTFKSIKVFSENLSYFSTPSYEKCQRLIENDSKNCNHYGRCPIFSGFMCEFHLYTRVCGVEEWKKYRKAKTTLQVMNEKCDV